MIAETGNLTTAGTTFASASGDINLSALEGDIYAGAYTDIFKMRAQNAEALVNFFKGSGSGSNSSPASAM